MKITALKPFGCQGSHSDLTFVKVETDEPGLYGWGECSLPGKTFGVQGAVRDLEKLVLGADPLNSERCWQRMYRHSYWRGGPVQTSALSGVDAALWDIRGKAWGQPVHRLLGGAVRDRVKLYANLGLSTSPDEFRERAHVALAMGFRGVKIYPLPAVGPVEGAAAIRQVAACCEALREVLGEDRDFALDFHGRCTAGVAVEMEAAVRHTKPLWIEEPVPAEQTESLRRVAEKSVIPLAAGERLFTRWGFRQLLEEELVSVIQPDSSNAGGISEMIKIAAMAECHGVGFFPHSPNGPLQALASLHLSLCAQTAQWQEYRHDSVDFMREACSAPPLVDAEGYSRPSDSPGLGAEMNEDFLLAHPPGDWIPESFRADGSLGDW